MNDEWKDLMPDSGDHGISPLEAAHDVVVFLAKIVGVLLATALVIAVFAYSIWREFAVLNFLLNN